MRYDKYPWPVRWIRIVGLTLFTFYMSLLQAQQPPNVLVILSDDQGWGDLSLNGNRNLSTPRIDSLATDGVMFDRFYVCPVCSPTRAEFLTGRYHPRGGVYSTSAGGERLDLDETTLAQVFKSAGYATGAFGKWHNGMQPPYHPNARGFDEFYGFCSGHWGNYFSPPLEHNGKVVKGEGFVIDDFTSRAMAFIEANKERPFFCYVPYNTPHSPMQVPDEYWDRFKDKDLELRHRDPELEDVQHTRAALAMCENIDWNVGRLLDHLERLNLSQNTIVLYFCDNGPNGNRWNGGMKGRKGSTDEGGVRSPLLIRWKDKIQAGIKLRQIGAAIDLLPTLTELAGIKPETAFPLDGISLAPWLRNPEMAPNDRLLFSHWNNRISVRSQRFRMDHQGGLFDMDQDGEQRRDVAKDFPETAARLRKAVTEWRETLLSDYRDPDRPFTVGHPGYDICQLPARDAVAVGEIKRSNRFPNDSYFTDWKSVRDHLEWPVEVLAEGVFDVELYLTCSASNVGSLMALEWNGQQIQARIDKEWDPPVQGDENDRVQRQESYVKDFKPYKMGRITLDKGRGTMKLKAQEIPGTMAPEFRLMVLYRVH